MDCLDRQRQQHEDRRYLSLGYWINAKAPGTGVRAILCRPSQPRCSSSVCHNRKSRHSRLCHGVGRSCPHTYSVTTIPHCVPTAYFGASYNSATPADLQHEACWLIRSPVLATRKQSDKADQAWLGTIGTKDSMICVLPANAESRRPLQLWLL